jgi:hypothetical protein
MAPSARGRVRASPATSRRGRGAAPTALYDEEGGGEEEPEDAEEGGGEEDNGIYCLCQRQSFGEMVACDNEDCKYQWVSDIHFIILPVDLLFSPRSFIWSVLVFRRRRMDRGIVRTVLLSLLLRLQVVREDGSKSPLAIWVLSCPFSYVYVYHGGKTEGLPCLPRSIVLSWS